MWSSERGAAATRRQWLLRQGRRGLKFGLLWGLVAATSLPLAGCGFALRQTPPLPFTRINLSGFAPYSPLAEELRARLADSNTQVLSAPALAQVVLHTVEDRRERRVVASTAVGQVRELQLRVRFHFRLSTASGRELIPLTELLLSRDMSYNETAALAKGQEEAELYNAMQTDIVQQVLRRLARAPQP